MEKKIFAFILMGAQYAPAQHQAHFETEAKHTYIYTVRNYEEAKARVRQLKEQGCGAIELCGAFGPDQARELIDLTGGTVAIGYVTHFSQQDDLFDAFFSK